MPSYEVKAVDERRTVIVAATVDTATAALMKLRDAHEIYRRAWVVDSQGVEVSGEQLLTRSWEERTRP